MAWWRMMAVTALATLFGTAPAECGEVLPRVIRPSIAPPGPVVPRVVFRPVPPPRHANAVAAPDADSPDWTRCGAAIRDAERNHDIPEGLLAAIARVETGRRHPSGLVVPWPWSINVGGEGRFFATQEEAEAEVARLLALGVRSIDVGCLQVNLAHHPHAFSSVAEAFDPGRNARYAATFLRSLHARFGDWGQAVAAYHSATVGLARGYHARVSAAWRAAGGAGLPDLPIGFAGSTPIMAGGGALLARGGTTAPQPRVIRAIEAALTRELR